jgi:uncharacterized protein (TIGR04141 family)
MPDDKKEITIYAVDKDCEVLAGKTNILQECLSHVIGLLPRKQTATQAQLPIDTSKFPDFNVVGIYFSDVGGNVSWINYLNKCLTTPLQQASNGRNLAILFLEHKTTHNIYAISFGLSHHLIKDLLFNDFGLDILSRLIDPNKTYCKRTTAQPLVGRKQGEVNVYRGFQTLENNIDDFGKIFQELFVLLDENKLNNFGISKTSGSKRSFTKTCMAKDSFKINYQTTAGNINALLNGCEWAKTQPPVPINSVKMLDKKLNKYDIDFLDAKVYDSLYDRYLFNKNPNLKPHYEYDICNKDFENYLLANEAKTTWGGKSIKFSHPPITIDELFRKLTFNNINQMIDWLEKKELITFNQDGIQMTKDTIKRHLFAEQSLGTQQHFLLNGTWFSLDNNFLEFLNNKIKDFCPTVPLSDFNFINNWNGAPQEEDFIKTHDTKSQCICIHPNLTENIEFCDMMHWDDKKIYLYFIKDTFGNQIRSLSSQLLISSYRLSRELATNMEYIKTVYADILAKRLTTLNENEFINLFKTKEIISVFAFHDTSSTQRILKDEPEKFHSNIAKYSLVNLIGEMRKLDKVHFEVHQIEN